MIKFLKGLSYRIHLFELYKLLHCEWPVWNISYLKKPVIRDKGVPNGAGFRKRYATNNSTASSWRTSENICDAIQRFASLQS